MLSLLPTVAAGLHPTALDRMARLVGQLPLPVLRRRAKQQAAARAAVLGVRFGRPDGPGGDASARAAVIDHARFIAEFLAALGGQVAEVEAIPSPLLLPAPRGRLVVTLHTGNWIVGAVALARAIGELHSVAGTQLHPRLASMIERRMGREGVTVHRGEGVAGRLLHALRCGKTVVLHLDGSPREHETWPRNHERAELLGVRAAATLASRSGVDVCFALCRRVAPGRFRIEARSLPRPAARARSDEREAWVGVFRRLLTEEVAAHPDRWLIFRAMETA